MTTLLNDIKYAIRSLRMKPGFTAVAILILALGIGANTALFSLIHAVIFSPLPFENPERLMIVQTTWTHSSGSSSVSGPDFLDWQSQNTVFDNLCALDMNFRLNLTGQDEPLALEGARVSTNFFDTMGQSIALGRSFSTEEANPGKTQVTILGDRLWRDRFGADPNIVGKTITLDSAPWTVIGVAEPTMGFIEEMIQLYVPLPIKGLKNNRSAHYLVVMGNLKADVPLAQAQAEMDVLTKRIEQQYPKVNKNKRCHLASLHGQLVSDVKTAFLVLYGAVGFLLLIACVNVSNLLLARVSARTKEIAVRSALGAGRWRIIRQMLTESLLLAVMGGGLGLVLGFWGLDGLKYIAPKLSEGTGGSIPGFDEISLNLTVLGFTLLVSLVAGVVFGFVPAWQGSRAHLGETLKQGGRSQSQGPARHRTLNLLVVAQVSLALILLSGAGLLIRSFYKLQNASPGFEADHILTVTLERPNTQANRKSLQCLTFYHQLLQQVQALPGVERASLIDLHPIRPHNTNNGFGIKGRDFPPARGPSAEFRRISPDYFQCMHIPVLQGRTFHPEGGDQDNLKVVISQKLKQLYFKDSDPLGQYLVIDGKDMEIIGVVGDVKLRDIRSNGFRPFLYQPTTYYCPRHMSLMVRTTGPPALLAEAVRREVWNLDPTQPILSTATMPSIVADSMSIERFCTILLVVMACVALLMAVVGLYSVMAFAVNERINEIGIRMALGAQSNDILKLIAKRGLMLTSIGLVIGLIGSIALMRCLSGMLYQMNATDPVTLTLVPMLLLAVAALACYLPARKAAKTDPMKVLRYE
ncbi:ABC transporter permease [Planctomycetota bacterium]